MKKLLFLSASILLLIPHTPVIARAASKNTCKRWNPGHYIISARRKSIEEIEAIISNPDNQIKGLQTGYTWRELEPQKDIYDFSSIKRDLSLAKKYNKQLFVQFLDRTWTTSRPIPDYLYNEPIYNSGVEPMISKGSIARIWDAEVINRANLLITSLGNQFDSDPNFEGIIFCESSINIDKENAPGFSNQALAEGMMSRIENTILAFPNSVVIQYLNYGPRELLPIFDQLYTLGGGMGGPDLVPDEGRYPTKTRIPAYDYYPIYAQKMPLAIAVQQPDLMRDDLNKKGIFTLNSFFDMAINTLKVNYIFWAFVEEPWHKFSFTYDILPYINQTDGYINDECPQNTIKTQPNDEAYIDYN